MADVTIPSAAEKKQERLRAVLIFTAVLAVVLVGVWGYHRLFVAGHESTDDAQIQGTQAVIASQTLGQVRTLPLNLGDRVTKGQVLATLDDRTQQSERNQVLALIEQARAHLHQAQVAAAGSADTVRLHRVTLNQAEVDQTRAAAQFHAAVISKEQYEHVQSALEAERASYTIAVGQQKLAQAQVEAAQAELAGAESQVGTVDAAMAHVVLAAPMNGVIARKWVAIGDVVQPAQPVYTVVDLDDLWVDAYFKETQVRNLRLGAPVTVTVDAYPGVKLTGRVQTFGVSTAAQFALIPQDNASGNFTKLTQRVPVRIALDRVPSGSAVRLVPGLSAEVMVATGDAP